MSYHYLETYLLKKLEQNGFQQCKEENDLSFNVSTQAMNLVLNGMRMESGYTCWQDLRGSLNDNYSCTTYRRIIDKYTYCGVYLLRGTRLRDLDSVDYLVVLTNKIVCISYDILHYSVYDRYLPSFFAEINDMDKAPDSPLNRNVLMGYRKL